MAHDVFISYSSKDQPCADAVCAALEQAGHRYLIASRHILPGEDWATAIMAAINQSRAMVLIFSGHANVSAMVQREVERAFNRPIPVIPMRIEDIMPSGSLELLISAHQWLDAFTPPFEAHLAHLAGAVRTTLDRSEASSSALPGGTRATTVEKSQPSTPGPAPGSNSSDIAVEYDMGVIMYLNNSYTDAARQFDIAANGGHPKAQIFLALLYRNGQGVPRDEARARWWMQKAANGGDNDARKWLADNPA